MTKLRVLEILEEKNKTKYWLCKRMEMHYISFNKMVNNDTNSIRFDTLDRLSQILEVPVGDLFTQIEEPPKKGISKHISEFTDFF